MAEISLNIKLNVLAKNQLEQLESTIKQIGDSLSNVKVNRNLTAQINALTKQYNALAKAAQTVAKANNKQQIEEQKLAKVTAQANTAKINKTKANVQLKKSELQLNIAKDKATKVTEQNTIATKKNTKSQLENRQSMLSMMQGFLQWQLVAMAVMKPLNLIRNAWASINETLIQTEDAVIALQRVLPSGSASDSDIANKLYDLAQKYGQTFENASEIATNFARTGMSWADTIKATEAALLALNVAELDATQASDGLIAVMSQFHYSASELTKVIDMLNKTADNFPVTTEKLLTALQRTGSSADNANLSLEETIGLVTALSKATGRSGENIGTAVNSLIQYSSKGSSLDVFASLDERTADVVGKYRKGAATILDVWQEVSRVINSMDERQESILSGLINDDDIKNLETELQDELGDIFETVSDVYGTANTFRKNYFIALLGDMQTVQEAIDTARDSQGYSQAENEKYLDTYTAKVNKLQAQCEKLANDENGLLAIKKALVDFGSWILDVTEKIGGLKTVFVALGGVIVTAFGAKILSSIVKFASQIKNITHLVTNYKNALNASTSAEKAAHLATLARTKAEGIKNGTIISGTTAERMQIIATNAQAKADLAAAEAAKAKAAAIQSTIGWIGIGVTVITAIVGAIQNANREAEEARNQAIENYEANKETAQSLQELYNKYEQLNKITDKSETQEKNFTEVQKDIVDILKEKYNVLKNLTEGTDEYRQAVENLTNAELAQYRQQMLSAASAAEINLAKLDVGGYISNDWWTVWGKSDFGKEDRIATDLQQSGINIRNEYNKFILDGLTDEDTAESSLKNYEIFKKAQSALRSLYDNAILRGDLDYADKILKSQTWTNISQAISEAEEAVNKYLSTQVELQKSNYILNNGIIETEKAYENMVKSVLENINAGEYFDDTIKNLIGSLEQYVAIQEEIIETEKTWEEQSLNRLKNYQDMFDVVNKMLNAEQAILDVEEKRKALEDARNNRNVRVFNASTGNWELQADQNAIAKAEKDYQSAVWTNIQNEIESGNLTVGDIYDRVKEISDDLPVLANGIRDWLVGQGYDVPAFDNGGVLQGLGGIKATMGDEIVLPPEITRKILQPTSNEQFSAFVKDLGILFGASNKIMDMHSGMVTNSNSSIDNSNSNNSYVVNGVPISKETAEKYTIMELFENAATFQN